MYAREAEEEIVFLSDAFLSHVPEAGAHLPVYRSWIDDQDFTPAYAYLHRMLQFLQWQKRQRSSVASRWVLKSPAHLGYLDRLREQFPDLHVVHMHRDPRDTIASGASLNATLHAMHADTVDLQRVGAEWLQRMGWTNDRAMATRDSWADEAQRVTDIEFGDAVADPIGQVGAGVRGDRCRTHRRRRGWRCAAGWSTVPGSPRAPPTRSTLRAEWQPDRRALRRLQREIPVRAQTQRSSECLTTP